MRLKMLLAYNVLPEHQEEYMSFMMSAFVPTLQQMGLTSAGVWHTVYGNHPARLIVFVADDRETMDRVVQSKTWRDLESRLEEYATDYSRRIVSFEPGFQF